MKLDPIQPRHLRFRSYYRLYVFAFSVVTFILLAFWYATISEDGFQNLFSKYSYELSMTGLYFCVSAVFYFLWLRTRLKKAIQVFPDHVLIHKGKDRETVKFEDIESVHVVWGSIFYVKLKNGIKHYFNSSFERIDYIWEGIYLARPELMDQKSFEDFRIKLVQYDHHQKRKEWFFKHKLVDIFNWTILPLAFVVISYLIQSRNVTIHQQGLYFFRLFMYSMLVSLTTAFFFSILLKKLIFDRKVYEQIGTVEGKVRDLEFEGVVLQRSKIFQLVTACFVLALVVKYDVNFYSISKVKEDIAYFKLKKGNTILVDNRYNCLSCRFRLSDGDFIVFGRGTIGQVMAKEGEIVGQISQDAKGRMIASQNIQEVPRGHLAVRAGNGKDIVFVRIEDLIGKIQN